MFRGRAGECAGSNVLDTRVSTSAAAAGDTSTSCCNTRRVELGACGEMRVVT
jgi:hypothetical protein